jgi:hypothetical protein
MTSINNLSLQNLENYNKELSETPIEVFYKYNEIMNDFIVHFSNISSYTQNEYYIKYILKCGINTVTHIFNIISLYTMNMDLTKYYCGQGAYYYSEFTEQMIGDDTIFLKLTSNDAVMFVYKKTIFEINEDYKGNFSSTEINNNKFSTINLLIKLYTDMIFNIIDRSKLIKADIRMFYKEVSINRSHVFSLINSLYSSTNKIKSSTFHEHLKLFSELVENLKIQLKTNEENLIPICELYIKKISKLQAIDYCCIEKKIHQEKFKDLVSNANDTYSINKLINWLIH